MGGMADCIRPLTGDVGSVVVAALMSVVVAAAELVVVVVVVVVVVTFDNRLRLILSTSSPLVAYLFITLYLKTISPD